jgi:CRP/FNR family transcriptional regulator, cyclic AMP receptor protein
MVFDSNNRDAKVLASFFKVHGKTLTYKKGRRLLPEELSGHVVYVKSGYLIANALTKQSRSRARAYYTFGPSNIIQQQALLPHGQPDLVYTALSNVVLIAVHRDVMWREIIDEKPLTEAMVRDLIRQSEMLTRRVENLSYRYASDKLIYRILNLAERFGIARDSAIVIRTPVTHNRLGMFINMARESVSREMEKLVNRGLISYDRQHITILDLNGLIDSLHESVRTDWSSLTAMVSSTEAKN